MTLSLEADDFTGRNLPHQVEARRTRDARILELARRGVPPGAIKRELALSVGTLEVQRILGRARQAGEPVPLFNSNGKIREAASATGVPAPRKSQPPVPNRAADLAERLTLPRDVVAGLRASAERRGISVAALALDLLTELAEAPVVVDLVLEDLEPEERRA